MNISCRPLIFLYKHYKALVLGWTITAVAAYILFFNNLPVFHTYPALMFLYFLIVIPLLYVAVPLYARTLASRINGILFDDCDPAPYIGIYEDIVAEFKNMNQPRMLPNLQISLSAGLAAAGRYSEAYETLKQCSVYGNSRASNISRVVYYNNLISVCIKLGVADEAEDSLDSMIKSIALLKQKDYKKYERHLKRAQYIVNIARGVYDYAEKAFTNFFETSQNNFERAASKFSLASVYAHFGDIPRAKEALEYVIAYGNKLHIVEEAKRQLKNIE